MFSQNGFCPCCEQNVTFASKEDWYRDHLLCSNCNCVVRERALAKMLDQLVPNWKILRIHESSPAPRGISEKLRKLAPRYIATNFYPEKKLGDFVGRFRNEDIEAQTFFDNTFDIVISLDVMEHVFNPAKAYSEIYRTLCNGGHYLHNFPIKKTQISAAIQRAKQLTNKKVQHLVNPPKYHGNPIDSSGSLVTYDYGYDITKQIADWAPFDVSVTRFWDPFHEIIGEYTEVVHCKKR